ncbi:MAG: hypothetical protein ABI898_11025, partial [Sphingomonadales bacterium]
AVADPGISAMIEPHDRGGVFQFSAPPSLGGALIQQLQFLPPGDYVLKGQSKDIDQREGEGPFWQLTCYDGRALGRVEVPNSTQSNGNFSGRIVVPVGCGMQMLAMIARPSNGAMGSSGEITRVQLRPAQSGN